MSYLSPKFTVINVPFFEKLAALRELLQTIWYMLFNIILNVMKVSLILLVGPL